MSVVTTRQVTDDEADIRLDRWFRRHYPGLDARRASQKLCRTGQIRVDGKRAPSIYAPGCRPGGARAAAAAAQRD